MNIMGLTLMKNTQVESYYRITFYKTILGFVQTPITANHSPESHQITPDSFSPKCFKRSIFSALECFIAFFHVCDFATQNWLKLLEYGNQPAGCSLARNPIQARIRSQAEIIARMSSQV
jgi:hypothetical protein